MKKTIFLLISVCLTNFLSAQTENYKIAIDNFQTNYNAEKYVEIFNSFSSEMQQVLPLENTKQFLTGLNAQFGKIESKEFVEVQQGAAKYKTKFERATLTIFISLNNQNKITGLLIKPYEEPTKTENKTVNALNNYPEEIAETIFTKSKEFPNNTQLSIAIVENGKTNYYGIIKENDSIKPIENQNKIFEIGSITKVFTSSVLASLVEDKKIELTDDINSFYPFDFKDNLKIDFKSLANHTSGLPRLPENIDLTNENNPYKNYGENELNEYLRNILKPENEISTTYSYSNLGAGLLGYTLGLSQNTSFQDLLQKRIFNKYEMSNSFTTSQGLGINLVKGLAETGEMVFNWDFDVLFGGGGILSTTEDLSKFAIAQFNPQNKELALTRIPTFTINDNMKIGLGWHILKSDNNGEMFWHNGGTAGYSSSIVVDIENKYAVIVLSNVSGFNPKMKNIDEIGFELINKKNKK